MGAGIPIGRLAEAVGVSRSCLSHYLSGRLRRERTQRLIWVAFRSLSRSIVSLPEFWGDLLSEGIAS